MRYFLVSLFCLLAINSTVVTAQINSANTINMTMNDQVGCILSHASFSPSKDAIPGSVHGYIKAFSLGKVDMFGDFGLAVRQFHLMFGPAITSRINSSTELRLKASIGLGNYEQVRQSSQTAIAAGFEAKLFSRKANGQSAYYASVIYRYSGKTNWYNATFSTNVLQVANGWILGIGARAQTSQVIGPVVEIGADELNKFIKLWASYGVKESGSGTGLVIGVRVSSLMGQ